MIRRILLFISLSIATICLFGQDIHFSQYFHSPLIQNPANTGLYNGDIRAGANYRSQWGKIAPYKTFSLFADKPIPVGKNDLGVGLYIYNDRTGDIALNTLNIMASVSYILALNDDHKLSLGIQPGMYNMSFDLSSATFPDQFSFNIDDFDQSLGNEVFEKTGFTRFDANAGAAYSGIFSSKFGMTAGVSVSHLVPIKENFNDVNGPIFTGTSSNRPIRIEGYIEPDLRLSRKFMVSPKAYYSTQGGASELNVGSSFSYFINPDLANQFELFFGGFYRLGDAPVFMVGGEVKNFRLGLSYDLTTSQLSNAPESANGFELALVFTKRIRKVVPKTTILPCIRFL